MTAEHRKILTMPTICNDPCIKKLKYFLNQGYAVTEVPSTHIKYKADLQKQDLPREIHLEVFNTSTVAITASPEISTVTFAEISDDIKSILKESTSTISTSDNVRILRARRLQSYINNLTPDDENQRMTIVVFCDIIIDLMLSAKLGLFTSNGLEDDIGEKLKALEKQYSVKVYKKNEILDIRRLRNKIVHGGTLPSREEANYLRNETNDIFSAL